MLYCTPDAPEVQHLGDSLTCVPVPFQPIAQTLGWPGDPGTRTTHPLLAACSAGQQPIPCTRRPFHPLMIIIITTITFFPQCHDLMLSNTSCLHQGCRTSLSSTEPPRPPPHPQRNATIASSVFTITLISIISTIVQYSAEFFGHLHNG